MIDVKFKTISTGTCAWCGKERDELFDVEYADKSFVGRYCRNDLLKAVGMKCEKEGSPRTDVKLTQLPQPITNGPVAVAK